ncbi:MAG: helix-turn-helix domain-containing protein [Candidatus Bathyarchaeia archaeon]
MNLQENVKEIRKEQAEKTDSALLDFLKKKPGALSLYQIAREIGWSIGRVQKSIERLLKKGLVTYKRAFLGGRSLKLVIPVKVEANSRPILALRKPSDVEIAIPIDMIDNEHLRESAFLYTLDRVSFGISSHYERKWHENSLFEAKVPVKKEENAVAVRIPEKVSRFYLLPMTSYEISASPKRNKVIISVGSFRSLEGVKNASAG